MNGLVIENADGLEELAPEQILNVIAVVKPYLAEKVLKDLENAPIEEMVVRSVKGYGRQKNYLHQYQDTEYTLAFLPKVEFQIWVKKARSEDIIRRIVSIARSGRMGDGKIMVLPALPV